MAYNNSKLVYLQTADGQTKLIPRVPLSVVVNDGYVVQYLQDDSAVPKVSQNMSAMSSAIDIQITRTMDTALQNYYDKAETSAAIGAQIAALDHLTRRVVDALPTSNIDTATIYMVRQGSSGQNIYTEYMYINGAWQVIGDSATDLQQYYTKSQVDGMLPQITRQQSSATAYVKINDYSIYETSTADDRFMHTNFGVASNIVLLQGHEQGSANLHQVTCHSLYVNASQSAQAGQGLLWTDDSSVSALNGNVCAYPLYDNELGSYTGYCGVDIHGRLYVDSGLSADVCSTHQLTVTGHLSATCGGADIIYVDSSGMQVYDQWTVWDDQTSRYIASSGLAQVATEYDVQSLSSRIETDTVQASRVIIPAAVSVQDKALDAMLQQITWINTSTMVLKPQVLIVGGSNYTGVQSPYLGMHVDLKTFCASAQQAVFTVNSIPVSALADGSPTGDVLLTGKDIPTTAAQWDAQNSVPKKSITDAISAAMPAGTVIAFAGSAAPEGFIACNGALIDRTTYADLFAAIGTIYGEGDGSTTFALPDLTDRFIQGSTTAGTILEAGLPNITGYMQGRTWLNTSTNVNLPLFSDFGGAFYFRSATYTTNGFTAASASAATLYTYHFSAANANSIYGGSTTVQPPALTMLYCIKY